MEQKRGLLQLNSTPQNTITITNNLLELGSSKATGVWTKEERNRYLLNESEGGYHN